MLQYQNNNDTINTVVQKNVLNFCTILSSHCNNWNSLLTEAIKPVQALVNFSEQLRHVEKANIKYIDDFEDLQQKLLYKITSEIEDEIQLIKDILLVRIVGEDSIGCRSHKDDDDGDALSVSSRLPATQAL
ncbi:uncharacterized protein LOC130448085 isoform X2 [Diorhabda sublineata]|uniref:uncharacterized protein LOC130448085 isoform X2 n=1 Tax=Diorhabda sublineata TaxID=1163346 RepID=UPI0024E0A22D|nr:uncharacterized protein LOC130448085 isoform X2 [Diorhabda sublineata]